MYLILLVSFLLQAFGSFHLYTTHSFHYPFIPSLIALHKDEFDLLYSYIEDGSFESVM